MKTVVFASGKGGTGKTTLTALASHLWARWGIALADCDVEAANLPIALGAQERSSRPFAGGAVAVIDQDVCRGCGACARVCRFDAIVQGSESFVRPTLAVDPLACEGCGACVVQCPDSAIAMVSTIAGRVVTATSVVGPVVYGELVPGEDLSGKLVTEVRGAALEIAKRDGADLLVVDGPPGVGCPVIASVTNTDLVVGVAEPTVSGEHDLSRLVTLARRLGVRVAVVLNKADLSAEGAERVRHLARTEGLALLGEIPFDYALARTLEALAAGAALEDVLATGSPGLAAAREAIAAIETLL
ncbi:ATP-binding protein [Coriobacteriia bacterium Es71-Z0120]|uniref:ATP-binding protein n=1 Tax=Parvivirga hydrogeniphila TaxID=2939460 RepID=UPI002260F9FF|nr:ATP-binding protein [Parvivirga hydrogeniphila]MCL4079412.1 ATP-binding protein [Parvivirga hydrogeniphila]